VALIESRCSTPEGIGTEIRPAHLAAVRLRGLVLNARRHRNGDPVPAEGGRNWAIRGVCSTPEGIGTEIRADEVSIPANAAMCSTPEGIGTEIREDDGANRVRLL